MYESRYGHYEHKYDWNFFIGFGQVENKKRHYKSTKVLYELINFIVYIMGVIAFVALYFLGK